MNKKKIESLRYFLWIKTNWIFKIICMDQHNLKISDNLYGSEQLQYLRYSAGIRKSWIFKIKSRDEKKLNI